MSRRSPQALLRRATAYERQGELEQLEKATPGASPSSL
jgi:predicted component of type VI protein secretion system